MKAEHCSVLVVDDQEPLRMLIKGVVKKMGMTIAGEASNGSEAVEKFSELRPTLVLLDINMPFKTGLEALQEIIALDPDASVVMLTSVAEMDTVKACLAAGALNYILKTNPVEKIRASIQATLDEL